MARQATASPTSRQGSGPRRRANLAPTRSSPVGASAPSVAVRAGREPRQTPARSRGAQSDLGASVTHVNQVRLVGKVSGEPERRELPSGDVVVNLRLVVARGSQAASGHPPTKGVGAEATSPGGASAQLSPSRRSKVDTIELACWSVATQATAEDAGIGDVLEVTGALRRRFYRGAAGLASRYEVEVENLRVRPAKKASRRTRQ